MQVVSGPIGKERVHYEAPAADRMRDDMRKFLDCWRMTARPTLCSKPASPICGSSLRDIEDLIRKKVLVKDAAGGRSTPYSLARIK